MGRCLKNKIMKFFNTSLLALPVALTVALAPALAHAAANVTLAGLAGTIVGYFNTAIYVIMSLAVLAFVWNIFKYFIMGSDNPTEKSEAGKYVLYSIVGFFIILSFWGLVNIVTNTFLLNNRAPSTGYFNGSGSGGNTRSVFKYELNTNTGDNTSPPVTVINTQTTDNDYKVTSNRGYFGRVWDAITTLRR